MKNIIKVIKINLIGGSAVPGAKLSGIGPSMKKFCDEFNKETSNRKGDVVPTIITTYDDRSFDFVVKKTPVYNLLLKAAKIEKGTSVNSTKVGKVTEKQIEEIAKYKMPDFNCFTLQSAMKMVIGTAASMGIEVVKE